MTLDERLVQTVPSPRQIAHQQTEFYSFIHFTINTFTDKEWGEGTEDPAIFNPYKLDAEQWVKAIKSAGMKGLILTCKHHDGFCLWPSKYTEHSVKSSPYKDGKGDIVKEVSDACRKYGLKFGVYLSPWDRNCKIYGQGKEYDDFFIGQLTELLTNYGELFSVWFDGACGEGPSGRKQYYDWPRYYAKIRELQPNACISVCGPDVRWCGNEAGQTRHAEWSVVPKRTRDTEKIAEASQQSDNDEFRQRKIKATDADLGSREILKDETELIWYPAEVDTSIRPGWFWHEYENDKVRSLEELINIYYNSVGGNATLLLNVPPTNEGLIHDNDVKRLKEIGDYIENAFKTNITERSELTVDSYENGYSIENVLEDNYDNYYIAKKGCSTATIIAKWDTPVNIGNIVLKENILCSQRIETFAIDALKDGEFTEIFSGTVIGYKRIVPLKNIETDCIRIRITDARTEPTLSFIGIYETVK
ncbi:MAG: alpha-L-fucosidase [Clostridia bacterium]|nr:alpha-L-fucosidase [Clostridia bacterium]